MQCEYEREALYHSAKSEATRQKRYQQWQQARKASAQVIDLYEDFLFSYGIMLKQFQSFLPDGQVRKRRFAEGEVQTAIDLMRSLDTKGLMDKLDEVEKILFQLFAFLDVAQQAHSQIAQLTDPVALPFWCIAWQYQRKARKARNNYGYQKYAFRQAEQFLAMIHEHLCLDEDAFSDLHQNIFQQLEGSVQSSAMVETINSLLRPFLNQSRDQISQELLNLVMFYHNHRQFPRGKRNFKFVLLSFFDLNLLTHLQTKNVRQPNAEISEDKFSGHPFFHIWKTIERRVVEFPEFQHG